MPPARSPTGTLYFNLRVQHPARNDQSIRRNLIIPCRSPRLPPPACATARARCGTGSCYAAAHVAPAECVWSVLVQLAGTRDRSRHLHEYSYEPVRLIYTLGTKNLLRSPF